MFNEFIETNYYSRLKREVRTSIKSLKGYIDNSKDKVSTEIKTGGEQEDQNRPIKREDTSSVVEL